MEKTAYVVIGVALGVVLTLFINGAGTFATHNMTEMNGPDIEMSEMDMAEMDESMPMVHQHPLRPVTADKPVPGVTHLVFPDVMGGYNVQIITRNFEFTPAAINREVQDNTGHAHLYVNGVKISRVYSEWFHLEASVLDVGENAVKVTLNANDHSEWAIDDQSISSTVQVVKAQ